MEVDKNIFYEIIGKIERSQHGSNYKNINGKNTLVWELKTRNNELVARSFDNKYFLNEKYA